MKKLIIILSLFLTGCFYQTVNSNDIEVATEICAAEKAKIVEITSTFLGVEGVTCSNRKKYLIDKQ